MPMHDGGKLDVARLTITWLLVTQVGIQLAGSRTSTLVQQYGHLGFML